MRVLAVHNQLWSHYKAAIFTAIAQSAENEGDFQFYVLQMALAERSRAGLGTIDRAAHRYPHELLFDTTIERVALWPRTRRLIHRTAAYNPQLLYLNGYYDPAYWVLLVYCRLRGIRVVMDFETTAENKIRRPWTEALKRAILSMADGFYCCGTLSGRYLRALGVRAEQILMYRTCVDNTFLRRLYDQGLTTRTARKRALHLREYNFIYAGRFVPVKNLSFFIRAWALARAQAANACRWGIVLSGGGPDKAAIEQVIDELDLRADVTMLDPCEWHEVPFRYALADVLVLPSLSEAWGFAVNEAMIFGLPVLVSDHCGSACDLVEPGGNGYTFDPTDLTDLAAKLTAIMDHPGQLAAMGARSTELIADHSLENVVADIVAGFHAVTNPGPRRLAVDLFN